MYKIIRANEGKIRQISDKKSVNNLITKNISPTISFATTVGTNFYEKEVTNYSRIYYVLEGTLELRFDGDFCALNVGDVCYMDVGTEYEMQGTFKAVVVNQPAFSTES